MTPGQSLFAAVLSFIKYALILLAMFIVYITINKASGAPQEAAGAGFAIFVLLLAKIVQSEQHFFIKDKKPHN